MQILGSTGLYYQARGMGLKNDVHMVERPSYIADARPWSRDVGGIEVPIWVVYGRELFWHSPSIFSVNRKGCRKRGQDTGRWPSPSIAMSGHRTCGVDVCFRICMGTIFEISFRQVTKKVGRTRL